MWTPNPFWEREAIPWTEMFSCILISHLFLSVFLSLWSGCVDGHVKVPLGWDAMSSVTAPDPQGPWWMAKRYATSLIQYFLKSTGIVMDWAGIFNVQVEVHCSFSGTKRKHEYSTVLLTFSLRVQDPEL